MFECQAIGSGCAQWQFKSKCGKDNIKINIGEGQIQMTSALRGYSKSTNQVSFMPSRFTAQLLQDGMVECLDDLVSEGDPQDFIPCSGDS